MMYAAAYDVISDTKKCILLNPAVPRFVEFCDPPEGIDVEDLAVFAKWSTEGLPILHF